MREPQVNTLQGTSDQEVLLIKSFVNDAKRRVEDAWKWSALRTSWDITTSNGDNLYSLTDSGHYVIIDEIHDISNQTVLTNRALENIKRNILRDNGTTQPYIDAYAVDGQDANGDVQLRLWPTPSTAIDLTVYGWKRQADLSADEDRLLIPATPVIYEALAYALRERGEVGGQTSLEVFAMAEQFIRDAIAHDSSLNFEETIWELC
jgi:hypothetical protein